MEYLVDSDDYFGVSPLNDRKRRNDAAKSCHCEILWNRKNLNSLLAFVLQVFLP